MAEVTLEVYDLSRGMAAAMSQAILGMRIDGIWHTGVVVFNKEYYFGGGIQCSPVGHFASSSGMQPSQSVRIGTTTKSLQEFENFLQSISNQFTEATYDLINNNCNNFSDRVCNFLTGSGIPSYIIDLPRIVFSTPGGAMLRPMIENMQNNIRQQRGGSLNPFPSASAPISSAPSSQIFESNLSDALRAGVNSIISETVATKNIKAQLDETPTISADCSTLNAIGAKILNIVDDNGVSPLNESEKGSLQAVISAVAAKKPVDVDQAKEVYSLLHRLISNFKASQLSCLFLLRLLALVDLQPCKEAVELYNTVIKKVSANEISSIAAQVMAFCVFVNLLSHTSGIAFVFNDSGSNGEPSAQSPLLGQLVDLAVSGMSHERQEVRQISTTLAYNFVLACTKKGKEVASTLWNASGDGSAELHQTAVQLLCGCLESVFQLQNREIAAVRMKKLACVCRIVRDFAAAAVSLIRDLGFLEQLETFITEGAGVEPAVLEEEKIIVEEILSIALQNT